MTDLLPVITFRATLNQSAKRLTETPKVLDALGRQAALVDCRGIVRSVNCHWRRSVDRRTEQGLHVGECYTDYLRRLIDRGDRGVTTILRAVHQICDGERWRFSSMYNGSGPFDGLTLKVTASRIYFDHERFALVTVQDVTALLEGREDTEA
jgi:hypothetical protein